MKSGLAGSDESLILLSESGVHELVNSGADWPSHKAIPNQKVGCGWKFHVAPEPSPAGNAAGSRGKVSRYVLS
jgi:hypothetical protein